MLFEDIFRPEDITRVHLRQCVSRNRQSPGGLISSELRREELRLLRSRLRSRDRHSSGQTITILSRIFRIRPLARDTPSRAGAIMSSKITRSRHQPKEVTERPPDIIAIHTPVPSDQSDHEDRTARPASREHPPVLSGRTEQTISYLTEALVRQGHEVTPSPVAIP